MILDAKTYLGSLGIHVRDASKASVGRLSLVGEFELEGRLGVVIRPKRGGVSDRYLELLASQSYEFVVIDGRSYPSVYSLLDESLAPVRALPVRSPRHFPSTEIFQEWARLIRLAAGRENAAWLGCAQLVARLDNEDAFGPGLVLPSDDTPLSHLGAEVVSDEEPFRTAAAILAGLLPRPRSSAELVRLMGAISSLHQDKGELSGLAESIAGLLDIPHLGARRLVVSSGAGGEVATLFGRRGSLALPKSLDGMGAVLKRLLPDVELVFGEFLMSAPKPEYEGVLVVPPLGLRLDGRQLAEFELSKRGGKPLSKVSAEHVYVEHALTATSDGGLLMAVLPEGLLASAGHASFREWLLKRTRLLAVISLPAGSCFQGTNVKCSVIILKKSAPSEDYPILMVDVEAERLAEDLVAAKGTLDQFLDREMAACV